MKKLAALALYTSSVVLASLAPIGLARAAFNSNYIISDSAFSNTNSISAAQIDAFLNTFANSCISPNSGFQAIDPSGYSPSGGYTYGGYVTAGKAIYDAAQAYGLNPQVLVVTLEKEQSLVTGRFSSTYCLPSDDNNHKYAAAVGYGCPDSGTRYNYSGISLYRRNGVVQSTVGPTCVNTAQKAGFSQQIIRAAWLFKFGQQRSLGNINWAVISGSWDNSDDLHTCYGGPMTAGFHKRCPSDANDTFYDGYTTIDGVSTLMGTGATAALYWYTPHFHGNQNFYNIFASYFGDPNTPCFGVANVTGATSGSKLLSYGNTGPDKLAFTKQNNTGSTCAEIHLDNSGFQSWAAHMATAMRATDGSLGTFVPGRAKIDHQNALNYILYSGAGGHVEVHRMSPDFKSFVGYYDVATDLTGITATNGIFVAGDFLGQGSDQLALILYSGAGGHVEVHLFDPSLTKAIGYYDVSTDLTGVTAATGTFVAGDFLGRGYDQLAYVLYSGAGGKTEVHMFNQSLTKATGFYDVPTDLTSVSQNTGTFLAGDFLGRGYSQIVYALYNGANNSVETHMFNRALNQAIGFQDIVTNIGSFDPAE